MTRLNGMQTQVDDLSNLTEQLREELECVLRERDAITGELNLAQQDVSRLELRVHQLEMEQTIREQEHRASLRNAARLAAREWLDHRVAGGGLFVECREHPFAGRIVDEENLRTALDGILPPSKGAS